MWKLRTLRLFLAKGIVKNNKLLLHKITILTETKMDNRDDQDRQVHQLQEDK